MWFSIVGSSPFARSLDTSIAVFSSSSRYRFMAHFAASIFSRSVSAQTYSWQTWPSALILWRSGSSLSEHWDLGSKKSDVASAGCTLVVRSFVPCFSVASCPVCLCFATAPFGPWLTTAEALSLLVYYSRITLNRHHSTPITTPHAYKSTVSYYCTKQSHHRLLERPINASAHTKNTEWHTR